MFGQTCAYSAFSLSHLSRPGAVSGTIASAGHSGSHTPQSMHLSALAVEDHADALAEELDNVEERFLVEGLGNQQQALARARRLAVRLHRLLATQRSLIHRFERDSVQSDDAPLQVETSKLAQRLDWLDQEMIGLRDRAHLLQEEVSLRMADQTNRNLQVLAIVTTVFLPATLITESSA
jgi:zinc transporter